ncbi:MAG: ABC transporter permease [Phycisphaerales bacterium]|nr:ABC transporter permease [Phycisphaerales bacterium]
MADGTISAMDPRARADFRRDNPLTRSAAGVIGLAVLGVLVLVCVGSLPWTLGWIGGRAGESVPYDRQNLSAYLLPPSWAGEAADEVQRAEAVGRPTVLMGTDKLGRDVFVRVLAGGGVSIGIGLAAAAISVLIGTVYGALAAYLGGRVDSVMMRIVDVLYGLPYILLVVLLAVAGDAVLDSWVSNQSAREAFLNVGARAALIAEGKAAGASEIRTFLASDAPASVRLRGEADERPELRPREIGEGQRRFFDVLILLTAIGGVSWLTMARVIRGQVLSLKAQPFIEAARAMGVPFHRQFLRHLLPNLLGPIIVYATLTVPQAILQEAFLSFLGIGVKPPLPSWGNLAAEGLGEINPVRVRWWLILFPCLMLATTLLALNFVGEGLREAFDPKRSRR